MVDFASDPDPYDDPERPRDPQEHEPAPEPRAAAEPTLTAQRVTMNVAKRWFDRGGAVLVSDQGHLSTIPVGPGTTTHSRNTTTWDALRAEVNMWRSRYPNQRYYKVVAVDDPYDPDDVAALVAHDAAAGLPGFTRVEPGTPGTIGWAEQILNAAPAGTRRQVGSASSTVLLSLAATVQHVGPEVTRRRLLGGVVVDLLALAHGPGVLDEFRLHLRNARVLMDEADKMAADENASEEDTDNVRKLAQQAADKALSAAVVLLS